MTGGWRPRVERIGDRCQVRVPWTATVSFGPDDVERVEDIGRTRLVSGIGAHGGRGHWTLNTRRRPATRIRFRNPARLRVLGFSVEVQVLDVAPATRASVVRDLGIS